MTSSKINHINQCELWTQVSIDGLISNVDLKYKGNNEPFLMVTIVDDETSLTFPIWDNIEDRKEKLEVGKILTVVGAVSEYDSKRQIKVSGLKIREMEPEEKSNFIPSYSISSDTESKFLDIVENLKEPYQTIVLRTLGLHHTCGENDIYTKFKTAPAAVRHHHNKLGGLFNHITGVLLNTDRVLDLYIYNPFFLDASKIINPDRIKTAAILHDFCKIYEYTYESAIGYGDRRFDHRLMFFTMIDRVNNEAKALDLPYLELSEMEHIQELVLTHHGPWGGYKPKDIEGLILFLADMTDSQIIGCIESNDPTKPRLTITSMIDAE